MQQRNGKSYKPITTAAVDLIRTVLLVDEDAAVRQVLAAMARRPRVGSPPRGDGRIAVRRGMKTPE